MNYANLRRIVWARQLIEAVRKSLVHSDIANTTYEGEARIGGTVKITQIGEVAVTDYVVGTDMSHETLDDAQLSLNIDQKKYIAFTVDETDAIFVQNDIVSQGISRGAYKVADEIDQFIAGKYTEAGLAYGTATSPKSSSSGTIYQHLAEFSEVLDEGNVGKADRWIVVPPWVMTKLSLAGYSYAQPNIDIFRNGYIGPVAGFSRVYVSNNVQESATGVSAIMASSGREAIAYAGAISGNIRILPAEKQRASNVDGVWVYGAKVVRPDMLAVAHLSETAN